MYSSRSWPRYSEIMARTFGRVALASNCSISAMSAARSATEQLAMSAILLAELTCQPWVIAAPQGYRRFHSALSTYSVHTVVDLW